MMKTVEILGDEFKLAYNLKTLFVYEEIAGHPYKGEKLVDTYTLMYAMLLANNEHFSLTFDQFIQECDDKLGLYSVFCEVLEAESRRVSAFLEDKKKVTK